MKDAISKVKQYCEDELKNIDKGYNPQLALERSYGAVTFVLNYSKTYNKELEKWWSDEIYPQFYKKVYCGRS